MEHLSKNQGKFYSQARKLTKNKELAWDIIQQSYEFLLKRDQENNYVDHPDSYLHLLILGRFMNNKRLAHNKFFDSCSFYDDQVTDIIQESSFSELFEQVMVDINNTCFPMEKNAIEHMLDQNRKSVKDLGSRYQSIKTSRRIAIQRMKQFYKNNES